MKNEIKKKLSKHLTDGHVIKE